jgi:hypothetical protein
VFDGAISISTMGACEPIGQPDVAAGIFRVVGGAQRYTVPELINRQKVVFQTLLRNHA